MIDFNHNQVKVAFFVSRLLDWRERRTDGPARKKNERIIVFRNVFDPKEFDVSYAQGKSDRLFFHVRHHLSGRPNPYYRHQKRLK